MRSTPAEYCEAADRLKAALDLEAALDALLDQLSHDHAALLRRACQVPDETLVLRPVAESALLGHVLIALYRRTSRKHCDSLCSAVLGAYIDAESQMAARKGTSH